MLLLTELEVHTRKYLFWLIQGVWTERSEAHGPWMSEQIFPIWTKISVNKSFVVDLHKWNSIRWNFTEKERCILCQCVTRSIRRSIRLCTDCISSNQIKEFVPYFEQCTIRRLMTSQLVISSSVLPYQVDFTYFYLCTKFQHTCFTKKE